MHMRKLLGILAGLQRAACMTRNRSALLAFVFSALFLGLALKALPVIYEENDDAAMLLISSGAYSGSPDAHLVFSNYFYGLLLKSLYAATAEVEWYSIAIILTHFIAFAVILSDILSRKTEATLKAVFLLLFVATELTLLLYLQFTTTAAVSSLAGLILIRRSAQPAQIAGAIIFVVATLIRFDAAVLVLLVFLPQLLRESIKNRTPVWTSSLTTLVLSLSIVSAFRYADHAAYSRVPNWDTYSQYNSLRGTINDNPNAWKAVGQREDIISDTDYSLLLSFFPDPSIVTIASLEGVRTSLGSVPFAEKLDNAFSSFMRYDTSLALILLATVSLAFYSSDTAHRVVLLSSLLIFLSLIIYISLDASLKYRVFLSASLPLFYHFATSASPRSTRKFVSFAYLLVFVSLIPLTSALLWTSFDIAKRNQQVQAEFKAQHDLLVDYLGDPAKRVVALLPDYALQGQSPFAISKTHFEGRIFFGGWFSGIPLNEHEFMSFAALIDGHGLLLKRKSAWLIPLIARSIQQNYGIQVNSKIVINCGTEVIVEFDSRGESAGA